MVRTQKLRTRPALSSIIQVNQTDHFFLNHSKGLIFSRGMRFKRGTRDKILSQSNFVSRVANVAKTPACLFSFVKFPLQLRNKCVFLKLLNIKLPVNYLLEGFAQGIVNPLLPGFLNLHVKIRVNYGND